MTTQAIDHGHGWLRNPAFDLTFIVGFAAVAIAAGAAVTVEPELFLPILALDLWLLGYHHVIATYTRLGFDRQSLREHRHLVLYLPAAVALAVVALFVTYGAWLLTTIYLHWQWWHYTRQSEGISKAYGGKSRAQGLETGHPQLGRLAFYLVPIAGMLTISARDPQQFLFLPVATLPVPAAVLPLVYAAAAAAVIVWGIGQFRLWRAGRLSLPYLLYVGSHFAIYSTAYMFIRELNHGWLAINIWHNAQYIAFVWMFNNKRFQGQVDAGHVFLSTISQNGRLWLYLLVCLTLSTAFYFGIESIPLAQVAFLSPIVFYQTINFHHYIVDSIIWKLRKPPIRSNLGIT